MKVTSPNKLRSLPSEERIAANTAPDFDPLYGRFKYAPAVDGNFVTQDIKQLLIHVKVDHNLRIMDAHT